MDLNKWELENLTKSNFFILSIIAASGKGKTTLLKYLLKNFPKCFDIVHIFCGSKPSIENNYNDVVPPDCIHSIELTNKQFSSDFVSQLENYAKFVTDLNLKIEDENKKNNTQENKRIRTLFVFDDLGSETKILNDMISKCRHAEISIIMLVHREKHLSKPIREGSTHVFSHVATTLTEDLIDKNIVSSYNIQRNKFLQNNKNRVFFFYTMEEPTNLKWFELSSEDRKPDPELKFKFYSTQIESMKNGLSDLCNS